MEEHNEEEHNEDNIEINNNIEEDPETTTEQETTEPEFGGMIYQITGGAENFRTLLEECEEMRPMIDYLQTGELCDNKKMAKRVMIEQEFHFLDENGILCRYKTNTNKKTRNVSESLEFRVIPVSLREDVLELAHSFTHYGIERMMKILESSGYKWNGIYRDVRNYVLRCRGCATSKRGLFRNKAELGPLEIPTRCLETLHFDVIGPLAESENQEKYQLTVIDSYSAYVWLFPLKEQTSEKIAEKLLHVFSQVGLPDKMISDLGTPLVSKVMEAVWEMLGVKHIKVAPYNQKSNAKIERRHRVIGDLIRALLENKPESSWSKYIVIIEWAIRSSVSQNSPYSPSEILHGFPNRLPLHTRIEEFPRVGDMDVPKYVDELKERMKVLYKAQDISLKMNQDSMVQRYNAKARPTNFVVGDEVYLKNEVKKVGECGKFRPEFLRIPYKITEILSRHNLRLQNTETGKMMKNVVHIDRVKRRHKRPQTTNEQPEIIRDRVVKPDKQDRTKTKKQINQKVGSGTTGRSTVVIAQEGTGEYTKYLVQTTNNHGKVTKRWRDNTKVSPETIAEYHRRFTLQGKPRRRHRRERQDDQEWVGQ